MLIDIEQIPYSEIKRNSVLVLRVPAFGLADKEAMDRLTTGLREKVDETVSVIIMREDTEVFLLPEEVMNGGGWYKLTPEQKTLLALNALPPSV